MVFDLDLIKSFPGLQSGMENKNDGLCPICYLPMEADSKNLMKKLSLTCTHVFC
jgi:hypothetical protein